MIFKPILIDRILAGAKTMTRRPVVDGKPCAYRVGQTYGVQPGMARPTVARILVTDVRQEPLGAITQDDARAEGFPLAKTPLRADVENPRGRFLGYWHGLYGRTDEEQLVWVVSFVLVEQVRRVCSCCGGRGVVNMDRSEVPA